MIVFTHWILTHITNYYFGYNNREGGGWCAYDDYGA